MFRPLAVVLGELAYLRPRLSLDREGIRYPIRQLSTMAREDLYRGPQESKDVLLSESFWWEDGPDGRTRVMRNTPAGPEAVFVEAT